MIKVNLIGTFNVMQVAAAQMLKQELISHRLGKPGEYISNQAVIGLYFFQMMLLVLQKNFKIN